MDHQYDVAVEETMAQVSSNDMSAEVATTVTKEMGDSAPIDGALGGGSKNTE